MSKDKAVLPKIRLKDFIITVTKSSDYYIHEIPFNCLSLEDLKKNKTNG